MKKIWILCFALAVAFAFAACGGSDGGSDDGSNGAGAKTSDSTDQWPSGVYEAYGIPQFKAGKIVYAIPDDPAGSVMFNASREELTAYIDSLLEKDFHMADNRYEEMKEASWGSFDVYFPKPGGAYSLSCIFSWENGGKGTSTTVYDEDEEDGESEVNYNVSFCIGNHGTPEGWNQKDIFKEAGLSDKEIIPENADVLISNVDQLVSFPTPLYILADINYAFDVLVDTEIAYDFESRLLQACIDASDDGKALDLNGNTLNPEKVKKEGCTYWTYTYKKKPLTILFNNKMGYGGSLALSVTEIK